MDPKPVIHALLCALIRRAWDTYFFVELELRHSLIYFIHTEVLEEQEACETQSKNTISESECTSRCNSNIYQSVGQRWDSTGEGNIKPKNKH